MESIDCMIGLSGKEGSVKRFGKFVGYTLNSFTVFFLNSDIMSIYRVVRVGVEFEC